MNKNVFLFILITFIIFPTYAVPKKLPIPRYVTIKFNQVNARTGPTEYCPIEWVFIKEGEPVEIIAEYDQWYKIRDIYNEGGWVHSRAISEKRSVILISSNIVSLVRLPKKYNKVIANLTPQLRCKLHKCNKVWCKVTCKSFTGWVERKVLWGV